MKRNLTIILLIALMLSLVSCGGGGASGRTGSGSPSVSDVLESGMASEDAGQDDAPQDAETEAPAEETAAVPGEEKPQAEDPEGVPEDASAVSEDASAVSEDENPQTASSEEAVDIDLTAMSSTMVFSEVSAMLAEPDSFLGKTVRMAGQFAIYEDPSTGNIYFACIVQDATACCSNGIEFTLEGEPEYPQGYPELGSEITVTGTFDKYEENGFYYITLRNAHLI